MTTDRGMRKSLVAILIMFAMVFTTVAGLSSEVYAADAATQTNQTAAAKPDKVTGLKAVSGYKCITLSWSAVSNKSGVAGTSVIYDVYRGSTKVASVSTNKYVDKNLSPTGKYSYKIIARYSNGGTPSDASAAITKSPVHPAIITFTVGNKTTFYKDKKCRKKAGNFPKGAKITALGRSGDSYAVSWKGKTVYYKIGKAKSKKMATNKKGNTFSNADALSFISTYNTSSKTNWMVWVSTYDQKVYVLKKVGGKWTVNASFRCNTGKASSPTPTGSYTLNRKFRKNWNTNKTRHLHYMSCFIGNTAFHKRVDGTPLGRPASNGCIRLELNRAQYIYNSVPKKSKIIVY